MADLFFFPAYTFFVLREKRGGSGREKGKGNERRKKGKRRKKPAGDEEYKVAYWWGFLLFYFTSWVLMS
jgi:hypothetical protein